MLYILKLFRCVFCTQTNLKLKEKINVHVEYDKKGKRTFKKIQVQVECIMHVLLLTHLTSIWIKTDD